MTGKSKEFDVEGGIFGVGQKVKAEERFRDLRPLSHREEGTLHPAGISTTLKLDAPLFHFRTGD